MTSLSNSPLGGPEGYPWRGKGCRSVPLFPGQLTYLINCCTEVAECGVVPLVGCDLLVISAVYLSKRVAACFVVDHVFLLVRSKTNVLPSGTIKYFQFNSLQSGEAGEATTHLLSSQVKTSCSC